MGCCCSQPYNRDLFDVHLKSQNYFEFLPILQQYHHELCWSITEPSTTLLEERHHFITQLPQLIEDLLKMESGIRSLLAEMIRKCQEIHPHIYRDLNLLTKLTEIQYQQVGRRAQEEVNPVTKFGRLKILEILIQNQDFQQEYLTNTHRLEFLLDSLLGNTTVAMDVLAITTHLLGTDHFQKLYREDPDARFRLFMALKPAMVRKNNLVQRKLYEELNSLLTIRKNHPILIDYVRQEDHLKVHLQNFYIFEKRGKVPIFDLLKFFIVNPKKTEITKSILVEAEPRLQKELSKLETVTTTFPNHSLYHDHIEHCREKLQELRQEWEENMAILKEAGDI